MLRAFLVVWTMVAGLAAGGLLYIVGWRPQTTVVAERLTSPANSGPARAVTPAPTGTGVDGPSAAASTTVATSPKTPAPKDSHSPATSSAPWTDVVRSDPAADNPATTGSIGKADGQPKTARVAEGRPQTSLPSASEGYAESDASVSAGTGEPSKTAQSSRQPKRAGVAIPNVSAPSNLKAERATLEPAPARPAVESRESPARPASSVTAAAPALPTDPEPKPTHRKLQVAARSATAVTPPVEAVSDRSHPVVANRTLKQRARAAKAETVTTQVARAPERATRPRLETPRVAALVEDRASRPAAASETAPRIRQQARMAQRMRVARRESREGSLEKLMDDFSQSGADFLHERTMRVGNRYVVERTTRLGTQYFYQQSMR